MPAKSRYGRTLRPTQFYEPETVTVKDDYSTDDHDSGQFDMRDLTFAAPNYKRYHYDNYDPPQTGGGDGEDSDEEDESEKEDEDNDNSFDDSSSVSTDRSYVPSSDGGYSDDEHYFSYVTDSEDENTE